MSSAARAVLSGAATMAGIGLAIYFHFANQIEVGDTCSVEKNLAECTKNNHIVMCDQGVYAEFECKGPGGCRTKGESVLCDQSQNPDGDACRVEKDDQGEPTAQCGMKGKTIVSCIDGALKHEACKGPKGCSEKGGRVHCDQSVSDAGTVCEGEVGACTVDRKSLLMCRDGKYEVVRRCKGPKGCQPHENIDCDESVGEVGDVCQGVHLTCSLDHKSVLACRQGALKTYHVCRGPSDCTIEKGSVDCDMAISQAGDPCDGEVAACTADGKAQLFCKDGKFEKERSCNACVLEDEKIFCR